MTKKSSTTLRMSLQQAKIILLAKAAEESHDPSLGWTQADSEAASLRAAHALGEDAQPVRLLTERAKDVLKTLSERGLNTSVSTKAKLPRLLSTVLILLAFVAGMLTDRIASPEHIVNLLSTPFWGVILWNLLVYFALFCCVLGLVSTSSENRFSLPVRSTLNSLVAKAAYSTLRRTGAKAAFYVQWSKLVAPLIRMHVARTLHFSAVFFALGIIVSLFVRGFGTSYWAGWESTWLAESPQSVKNLLDYTYGLIPNLGILPAMPDVVAIEQMRADRLPYLDHTISAAPWLIRMMILMTVFVIIPRLIFIVFDTIRIRRFKQHVEFDIDEPHFANILTQYAQDAALGELLIITRNSHRTAREQSVGKLCKHWGTKDFSEVVSLDFDNTGIALPELKQTARKPVVALWFDGMETPEEDLHGTLLERAKTAYNEKAVLAVVVDLTEFSDHFEKLPERIKERRGIWDNLCSTHGVVAFNLEADASSQLDILKAIRAWAAPRSIVNADAAAADEVKVQENDE